MSLLHSYTRRVYLVESLCGFSALSSRANPIGRSLTPRKKLKTEWLFRWNYVICASFRVFRSLRTSNFGARLTLSKKRSSAYFVLSSWSSLSRTKSSQEIDICRTHTWRHQCCSASYVHSKALVCSSTQQLYTKRLCSSCTFYTQRCDREDVDNQCMWAQSCSLSVMEMLLLVAILSIDDTAADIHAVYIFRIVHLFAWAATRLLWVLAARLRMHWR